MKISKRSWHYRFLLWAHNFGKNDREQLKELATKSLCLYFWEVVGFLVLQFLFWVMIGAFALLLGCACVLASPWLAVWGLVWGADWAWNKAAARWRRGRPAPAPREPSLLAAYLKARKDRVCPLIEWTE